MSESSNEQTDQQAPDAPEVGLISDEQLPEDLQPAKNPLAADPEGRENE